MKKYIFITLITLIYSCKSIDRNSGINAITYKNIEKHIVELSADKYGGRMPLTEYEPITVDYIADQMQEIGLEPANSGSFFQEVPFLAVSSVISPELTFETPKGIIKLKKMDEYVTFSRKMDNNPVLENSEIIFAGFGITAPEYGRDDFAGIDLTGKTVLVFVNDPGFGTNDYYFKGNTMTYYGRWTYKFEEAARRGAKACLIIHETEQAGYPWSVVQNNGETTKLYLEPENGYSDRCAFEGWITKQSAEALLSDCGLNLNVLKNEAIKKDFKPYSLPLKVSGWMKNTFNTSKSKNVCGFIKGSKRPDELIVYTAHWDHLGIGTVINGDSIYNGATDNASAVAWMLEIARGFKTGKAPERSVLFLSVTGEESGLLGSAYYTENPFFEINKTVACINTDVLLFLGKYNDVTLTGYGQSELDDWVKVEAEKMGRYIVADPNPENGMYFRSDQFPFVNKGVPAIFAKGYSDAVKYGKTETLEKIKDYWKNIYHTPADEYLPERDDLEGVLQDAKLLYKVGFNLANSDKWPAWKEGSEFKSTREKSREGM